MIFNEHVKKISDLIVSYYSEHNISDKDVQIQETRKEFEGDWTLILFPFSKLLRKPIDAVGTEIGFFLKDNMDDVSDFNVVGGFLNLQFSDSFWCKILEYSFLENFETNHSTNKHIVVESCSPNTNKPLHLGHLRNILLGHAVANILVADGNKVTRVQIINDRGIHICKSMLAWMKFGNGEIPSIQ